MTTTDKSDPDSDKSGAMLMMLNRVFGVSIFLGLYAAAFAGGWLHIATTTLWALAFLAVGAFVGLLFGIPRAKPAPATGADPKATSGANAPRSEVNNNLIEVSDWLTKIIVGVGLVQLNSLPAKLKLLASPLAACLRADCGLAAAIGIIVFFGFAGFLAGYINARTFITAMFDVFDRGLSRPELEKLKALETTMDLIAEDANAPRPGQSLSATTKASEPAKSIENWKLNLHSTEPVASVAATESVGEKAEEDASDDPNKGAFGGSPVANGRSLQASIKPMAGAQSSACWIELIVNSVDSSRPLTGTVTLFLHPSFGRHAQYDLKVVNGIARDTILSWGVFTVGVIADGGETKLELDLATVTGGTKRFYEE
jgi:hypothetical protein